MMSRAKLQCGDGVTALEFKRSVMLVLERRGYGIVKQRKD